jgi:hypothetical protein
MSLCFPTLFPDGTGGITSAHREHSVSLNEAIEHYTRYADHNDDGSYHYRFATHHTFPFWIFNRSLRHTLLTQTNVFAKRTPNLANATIPELREELKKGTNGLLFKGLHVYQANFPGTTGFWYKQTQNLLAANEQLSMAILFWTISFPDYHLNELQNLMPWAENCDTDGRAYHAKKKMVNENPQVAAEYFHLRAKSFTNHVNNIFQATWYWTRIEAQRRATLQQHGCLSAGNNHDIIKNGAKALRGFLAQKKIDSLNQMDCSEIEEVVSRKNCFSPEDFANGKSQAVRVTNEIQQTFHSDFLKHSQSNCRWYIGVRAHPDDVHCKSHSFVLSGQEEIASAKAVGLVDVSIVKVWNNLQACLA